MDQHERLAKLPVAASLHVALFGLPKKADALFVSFDKAEVGLFAMLRHLALAVQRVVVIRPRCDGHFVGDVIPLPRGAVVLIIFTLGNV